MKDLTAEWLAKADEDFSVAMGLLRRRKLPANSICFHCQQAAEKAIKALLQKRKTRFGRIHDLEKMLRLLGNSAGPVALLKDDLKLLSDYAVRYRYPGQNATARQARKAGKATRRIRSAVLILLREE